MNNINSLIEKTVENKLVFSNKFLKVFNDSVELPNKKLASRVFVDHPGGVAIIAITKDYEIILEKQFRYSVKEILIELPMGRLEKNEIKINAAKRELQEETGFYSDSWVELGEIVPCNGYSSEKITYFLATDIIPGIQNLDDGEFLEVFKVPVKSALSMMMKGEIKDAKTISGLVLYLAYLKKNNIDSVIDMLLS